MNTTTQQTTGEHLDHTTRAVLEAVSQLPSFPDLKARQVIDRLDFRPAVAGAVVATTLAAGIGSGVGAASAETRSARPATASALSLQNAANVPHILPEHVSLMAKHPKHINKPHPRPANARPADEFVVAARGDTATSMSERNNETLTTFYRDNPEVAQESNHWLYDGEAYKVRVPSQKAVAPKPQAAEQLVENIVVAARGATATGLCERYGLTLEQFYKLNPKVAADPNHWLYENETYNVTKPAPEAEAPKAPEVVPVATISVKPHYTEHQSTRADSQSAQPQTGVIPPGSAMPVLPEVSVHDIAEATHVAAGVADTPTMEHVIDIANHLAPNETPAPGRQIFIPDITPEAASKATSKMSHGRPTWTPAVSTDTTHVPGPHSRIHIAPRPVQSDDPAAPNMDTMEALRHSHRAPHRNHRAAQEAPHYGTPQITQPEAPPTTGATEAPAVIPNFAPPPAPAPEASATPETASSAYSIDSDVLVPSGLSADQLNQILDGTAMAGYGQAIYDTGIKYGINNLYIIAAAKIESTGGTSDIAQAKNNWFGMSAFDSCPMSCAESFNSPADSIDAFAHHVKYDYLDPSGEWYSGGTTLHNIYVHYSTSHDEEAQSIADIMDEDKAKVD